MEGTFFIAQLSLTPIEMHLELRRQCSEGMIVRQTIHMWRPVKFRELGPPSQMSFVAAPSYVCLSVWLAGCMPVPNWLLSSLTPQISTYVPNYPTETRLYLDLLVCGALCRLVRQVWLYRVLGSHGANHPAPRSLTL